MGGKIKRLWPRGLKRRWGVAGAALAAVPGIAIFAAAPAEQAGIVSIIGDAQVPPEAIAPAIDALFAQDSEAPLGETRALVIMRAGKIIAERYAPGYGPETRHLSWSIAKTVTGLLVGIMVSDGRMALDEPAPLAAWSQRGDPRAAITLRQMMQMRTGLHHVEKGDPIEQSDALRMLVGDGAQDQAAYAAAKPLADPPGSAFLYSSATSLLLAEIVTEQLTTSRDPQVRRDAMTNFMRTRFTEPVGLESLVPEFDAQGTLQGAAMMHMTARDYARLGEFLRRGGVAGGRQLVATSWMRFMTTPSPTNAAYGGQLWLNRPGEGSPLFPGEASSRIYAAAGFGGQYIIVSPTQNLVIVRLGVTRDEEMPALKSALAKLVQRFPS